MPTTVIPSQSENQYRALTDAGYAALTRVHDDKVPGREVWEIETSFAGGGTRLDYTATTRPEAFDRLNELVAAHLASVAARPTRDTASDTKIAYREGPARIGRPSRW